MNVQPDPDRQPMAIGPNSRVRLHYAITLEDGTVADATIGDEPLDIILGMGLLHPHLEQILIGRYPGNSDIVTLSPEQGFGPYDTAMIQSLDRHDFPEQMIPQPGAIIGFTTPAGDEIAGAILEIQDDKIRVDFNHPCAGHTLTIGLKILSVDEPPGPDQIPDL